MISTIIPTFRRPHMLRRAIQSVLNQTFQDLLVCVYDNASRDGTEQLVLAMAAADPRVRYHCHVNNVGGVDNFLYGMRNVTTEFFSFLSDDDVMFPEFYARAVGALRRHPDAMMFAGSTLEMDTAGKLLYAPVAHWPREGKYSPPMAAFQMLDNKHPNWTSVVFRSVVIEHIGLLDRQTGAPSDLDYELRVAAHYPIVVSYEPCGAFVNHPQSGSTMENTSVVPGFRVIIDKFADDPSIAPGVGCAIATRLRSQLRRKLMEIAIKATVRKEDSTAQDAIALLLETGVSRAQTRLLALGLTFCRRTSLGRSLLTAAETLRLRFRAWRSVWLSKSVQQSDKRSRHDPSWYGRYLAFDSTETGPTAIRTT